MLSTVAFKGLEDIVYFFGFYCSFFRYYIWNFDKLIWTVLHWL